MNLQAAPTQKAEALLGAFAADADMPVWRRWDGRPHCYGFVFDHTGSYLALCWSLQRSA